MGVIDSAKDFFGFANSKGYEEDFEDDEEYVEEEAEAPKARRSYSGKSTSHRETSVHPIAGTNDITIITLNKFEDAMAVADILKSNRPVIFSVIELEKGEAERVVDLVTGAAHALDGNFERVSGGIFLAVPYNITIVNEKFPKRSKSTVNMVN